MVSGAKKGYLRRCMDRRFGAATRQTFEEATGLDPNDYWDEAYPGGAALPTDNTGFNYAVEHGAGIFGWQAHLDGCGGQPGVSDKEIRQRLQATVTEMKDKYPGRHFRIVASLEDIEIVEV